MRSSPITPAGTGPFVDPDTLACPGCLDPVQCEPPGYWVVHDGLPAPGFSHRDGTALCRDLAGQVCDPVEIALTNGW